MGGVDASIAIATCSELPDGDEDAGLLAEALRSLSIDLTMCVWDDPTIDWEAHDLVVLRSPWDYTTKLSAFRAWVSSLSRVYNESPVVGWNTDKRYLEDLRRRQIPVIETTYVDDPEVFEVPAAEWFVIKPTVGAGSIGAERFGGRQEDEARRHVAALVSHGLVAMVQPYLEQVDVSGETGVILIDGVPCHAIEKAALLTVREIDRSGLFRSESIRARPLDATHVDLALLAHEAACDALHRDAPLLYARVDMLPSQEGPVVIEFEATEPSLFLTHAPASASVLADAIRRRLG